jgi:hypothetical protein
MTPPSGDSFDSRRGRAVNFTRPITLLQSSPPKLTLRLADVGFAAVIRRAFVRAAR